jgi:hypothetical protein
MWEIEWRRWTGSGDEVRTVAGWKVIDSDNEYLSNQFKQITV